MLQAKSSDGVSITLATLTKAEIEHQKSKQPFYCPSCGEQVIIKAGFKMIPHFAHRSILNCPSHEGGEGPYHEKGKLLLYQWLRKQNLHVELEYYLPEINQRPDILLVINQKRIAIEYQCARITIEQIKQRNNGYKTIGITPIWILGANHFKRKTKNHLKIDQFALQFIHKFTSTFPLTLFYFCPDTCQFTMIQDLYLPRTGQAFGNFYFAKLNQLRFLDIFKQHNFSQFALYQLWRKEQEKFRLQQRKQVYGKELAWHQWLYLKRTHLEYLPSIIYLPVSAQYRMKTPLWNWQSRLVVDLLDPLPLGGQFSIQTCKHLLRQHLDRANNFPLIQSEESPLNQYLQLLEKLNVIKQLSPHHFMKIKPVAFYKNIEEALQGDEMIIKQLQKSTSQTKFKHVSRGIRYTK